MIHPLEGREAPPRYRTPCVIFPFFGPYCQTRSNSPFLDFSMGFFPDLLTSSPQLRRRSTLFCRKPRPTFPPLFFFSVRAPCRRAVPSSFSIPRTFSFLKTVAGAWSRLEQKGLVGRKAANAETQPGRRSSFFSVIIFR